MGKTLFIISHDDGYFEHADRLLMMKEGKLTELNAEERKRASADAIAMLEWVIISRIIKKAGGVLKSMLSSDCSGQLI